MLLLKSLLALALVAEAVVGGDSAFFQDAPGILAVENLDPIVTPNAQASHMHRIVGGSAFGASYNFATYSSASCSQLPVQADKSNYWMPRERPFQQHTSVWAGS
jgi:hypothetical protein